MAVDHSRRGSWPRNPIIYQIYPRSFRDSSGTGEGDLAGITDTLDHIAELGVDAIWLSPFFVSPMCDGGYDVVDHCAVDPRFGTLDDFDALVTRAHDLGLRVMIDQVFNHTSDQHPWFQASLRNEEPFRDFYVWADPKPDGSPPNNWLSYFGLPGWRWHHQRRQYCLHQFLPCQPCLNHHNDMLRDHLAKIPAFWRARGVDGFRFDAVTSFFHDTGLADNPSKDTEGGQPPQNPYAMQFHAQDMMPSDCAAFSRDLRKWAGEDAYLIGEINRGGDGVALAQKFSGQERLDAAYTVDLVAKGVTGTTLAYMIEEGAGQGDVAWWLASHDQPRSVSAHGDGSAQDARLFAAVLLALPGPILLFQGEELGQTQGELSYDQLHDSFDKIYWPDVVGRDGARCPFPWDDTQDQSGFTTSGSPWLPVGIAEDGGVAQQVGRDGSVLEFYRQAIKSRSQFGMSDREIEISAAEDDWFVARLFAKGEPDILLCANFGEGARDLPSDLSGRAPLLASAKALDGRLAPRSATWWQMD